MAVAGYDIHDQTRRQMLEETARFIEWGLRHPELVARIPAKPIGQGSWPANIGRFFWTTVLTPRDIRQAGVGIFRRLTSRLRGN